MKIIISNASAAPIYEQIASQIRNQIINGKLESGYSLPSIRALAKELQVSVITTKRAYDDLEREGFIHTVAGKGSFVAEQDIKLMKERKLNKLEATITQMLQMADELELTKEELFELIQLLREE
ncbi:GntR family transcriptional regulator [Tetragenococcus koreensis]|uniref:GntR family transcriptional regulator n=1 Tax=Tetragenococcus koreensis TaxID=290335 RepID=A0AAN4UD52_9ENTE|nr:GntR family transcriptional regulator [Tetragenococcus koreensis]MCF1618654.1 GntR family transcriptional regulator [Tetragenococcus koreensis]MCF1657811.1 GntR family transcriptional regulator [Tetragenococcus koreensis]GEQ50322.1 GntR family transcriptional regulator [Tetragenococcus koreensis]GEQ52794.1 GntR family transcriptional regulator [Tetragenococcus koreensis]GEQ55284.1 GntR family transcriptional regulator [Tetragenococcus koreensis]